MFQVFALVPTYNNYDAITGERAIAHPYAFVTAQGAAAVARMRNLNSDGDMVRHVAVKLGASPFSYENHLFVRDYSALYSAAEVDSAMNGDIPF